MTQLLQPDNRAPGDARLEVDADVADSEVARPGALRNRNSLPSRRRKPLLFPPKRVPSHRLPRRDLRREL